MPLSPEGLQHFLHATPEVVTTVAVPVYAAHETTYKSRGRCGLLVCQQDIRLALALLRQLLASERVNGISPPEPSDWLGLPDMLRAHGLPTAVSVDLLRSLDDFFSPKLSNDDAVFLHRVLLSIQDCLLQAPVAAVPHTTTSCTDDANLALQASAFEQALLTGVYQRAHDVVQACLNQGHSLLSIEAQVVQPAMVRIGEGWQANRVSVAQEHLASAVAQAVMASFMNDWVSTHPSAPGTGLRILLACVKGNHHTLGLRMVADAFVLHGWETIFLGPNVDTATVLAQVHAERPDVLGLSVSLLPQLCAVREVLDQLALESTSQRPSILLGGMALNQFQRLADLLPVDGFAPSAQSAVALAQNWMAARTHQLPHR